MLLEAVKCHGKGGFIAVSLQQKHFSAVQSLGVDPKLRELDANLAIGTHQRWKHGDGFHGIGAAVMESPRLVKSMVGWFIVFSKASGSFVQLSNNTAKKAILSSRPDTSSTEPFGTG